MPGYARASDPTSPAAQQAACPQPETVTATPGTDTEGIVYELQTMRREAAQACNALHALPLPVRLAKVSSDLENAVGVSGPINVGNFPTSFEVSNFPASQAVTCTDGCIGTGDVTATLASDDSDRLDLTWWGVWAGVGLLLAILTLPVMMRSFAFWRGDE